MLPERSEVSFVNVTFLIGNGFDIRCGIKSKYTDTYVPYTRSPSKTTKIYLFKSHLASNIDSWADFEMEMSNYATQFPNEDSFIECLRDYTSFLDRYLQEQENEFINLVSNDYIRSNLLSEISKSLRMFYLCVRPNDTSLIERLLFVNKPIKLNFISFNYTKTLDRMIDDVFSTANHSILPTGKGYSTFTKGKTVHIHGTLSQDITLGIDNEKQLGNLPYTLTDRGRRSFIKPVFNENYDLTRISDTKSIISSSSVICIFGVKLGESDASWRKELAEWILRDKNHHLIVYKRKFESLSHIIVSEKMDIEDGAKTDYIKYLFRGTLTSDQIKRVKSQIHIPIGNSIFNIEDAITSAKGEEVTDIEKHRQKELVSTGSMNITR